MRADHELIAAISTPPGASGIAVVRLSGDGAATMEKNITGEPPTPPRMLAVRTFLDARGETIDRGMAALFKAPKSFTGQDMLELHCHGGPAVAHSLFARCLELGARAAQPGEFSLRAYLNGKIDLARAEAICDLINASTEVAARAAARAMEGSLSEKAGQISAQLAEARVLAEAHLDFPDEGIPPETATDIERHIGDALTKLKDLLRTGQQGALLSQGIRIAVVGAPNVGKSSLINRLCGEEISIVTDIPGTTRDLVRQSVSLDGVRVEFVDTAGLRDAKDPIEAEGISRTLKTAGQSDLVVLVLNPSQDEAQARICDRQPDLIVHNKIDLSGREAGRKGIEVWLSAKRGDGIDLLRQAILERAGHEPLEGVFMARPRHLDALSLARERCEAALQPGLAPEIVAEELRCAQEALGEIAGRMTPDDLLGKIFSRFCIGK